MLGATVKTDGTLVMDDEGTVVYRADALVPRDLWERVQARLAANPASAKVNTWLLTQVAFCATCKAAMYGTTAKYGEKTYAYYGCVHSIHRDEVCTGRRVKADELETAIGDEVSPALVGDEELTEDMLIASRDFSEEINRTVEHIDHQPLQRDPARRACRPGCHREKQATLQRAQEELSPAPLSQAHGGARRARTDWHDVPPRSGSAWRLQDGTSSSAGPGSVYSSAGTSCLGSGTRKASRRSFSIPRTAIIDRPKLHAMIYLGSLDNMLSQARNGAVTVPAS